MKLATQQVVPASKVALSCPLRKPITEQDLVYYRASHMTNKSKQTGVNCAYPASRPETYGVYVVFFKRTSLHRSWCKLNQDNI